MKKVLALVVCVFAVAAAVIALSQPASAASAASVIVVDGNGTHTLNATNSMLAESGGGTVSFDATTGELTLKSTTGLKQICKAVAGDLTIILEGNNVMNHTGFNITAGSDADIYGDNLTIKGTGTLTATCTGTTESSGCIEWRRGCLTVTDNVTLNLSGYGQVMRVAGSNKNSDSVNIVFSGNSKVNITAGGSLAIYVNASSSTYGKLIVEENADVTINAENVVDTSNYATAVMTTGLEINGGSMEINVVGDKNATKRVQGIYVNGKTAAKIDLSGGKLIINASSNNSAEDEVYAMYVQNGEYVKFSGTDVELNVTTPVKNTNNYSGAILLCQNTLTTELPINVTAGSITANCNVNTSALFVGRICSDKLKMTFSGGSITGTVPSLIGTNTNTMTAITLNVLEGAKLNLTTAAGVIGGNNTGIVTTTGSTAEFAEGCGLTTDAKYLLTANNIAAGALESVTVTDSTGDIVLNAASRVYNGEVGRIAFDPLKGGMILDGVVFTGDVTAAGNVPVTVTGTNVITGTISADGAVTMSGTGSLELNGMTADNVSVTDAILKVNTSEDSALQIDAVSLHGEAELRIDANGGYGMTVKDLAVNDNAHLLVSDAVTGVSVSNTAVLAANADINSTFELTAAGATVTSANTNLTVTTSVSESKVVYSNGVYAVVALPGVEKTSTRFGQTLSLIFFYKQSDLGSTDGLTAYFTKGGVTTTSTDWSTYTYESVDYYVVELTGIAAKEMADEVSVVVKDSNENAVTKTSTTSLRTYAMSVLAGDPDEKTTTLMVDMLNYGAAAQTYFKYNTGDLANKLLTDDQKAPKSVIVENDRSEGIGDVFKGSTLRFNDEINMIFFFALSEKTTAVFTWTDHYGKEQSVTVSYDEYAYYEGWTAIELKDLVVADGRQSVTCKVYSTGDSTNPIITVTDSVESYVARCEGTARELGEAFVQFSDSAKTYLTKN